MAAGSAWRAEFDMDCSDLLRGPRQRKPEHRDGDDKGEDPCCADEQSSAGETAAVCRADNAGPAAEAGYRQFAIRLLKRATPCSMSSARCSW
jgi:hypothetical protein